MRPQIETIHACTADLERQLQSSEADNERLRSALRGLPDLPCCDRCRAAKAALADEQTPAKEG